MPMIRKTFSALSLLARFTLVSLFITLLIATGLAWRLELALERDALSAVAENTADQARHILSKNLTAADLETALGGQRYEQIDTLIHDTLLSTDIVRIKIWNRDGMLVYSDDQNIMGKVFSVEEDMQEAFHGEIASDVTNLESAENIDEQGQYTELFEIYVPLEP